MNDVVLFRTRYIKFLPFFYLCISFIFRTMRMQSYMDRTSITIYIFGHYWTWM